ncbi:MAG: DUF2834 domain-containing protein [Aureispira sp.]|nr:DUF2834 domain-containing protein [Aureispira sp.]
MKTVYLILTILGIIAPNVLVIQESIESGNIMLWLHLNDTFQAMFANRISSIFMIDLLFAVLVFMIWSYQKGKQYQIKQVGWVWVATMLLGLAGGFPMMLYLIEKKKEEAIV